jgi:hypothetical protein
MAEPFESILAAGKRNSLGRTEEVVDTVLNNKKRLPELFGVLDNSDEWVRMRAGDALEKICRERPEWFQPYFERLATDVSKIDQPSVQWHLAQMFGEMSLSPEYYRRAKTILKRNLVKSNDWIVLNVTMQQLFDWAQDDARLRGWLRPQLERLSRDDRGSVKKRASKLLAIISE